MIEYVWPGDLFASTAQTLVVPVNTVGVMGKGLARDFRERYPAALFDAYRAACRSGALAIGRCWLYRASGRPWVLAFPTKLDWRAPSRIRYVQLGLADLAARYRGLGITSLATPQLGCGLGGLPWADVRATIEHYLASLDIPVQVYGPRRRDGGGPSFPRP